LKEKSLDHILWRTHCERGYEPVIWILQNEWTGQKIWFCM